MPIDRPELRKAILEAVAKYPIESSSAWASLDELSSRTKVDGLEPNPDGIFQTGDGKRFELVGKIYVVLEYGGSRDHLSVNDSFPIHISGEIGESSRISITNVEVDTSSFYG